MARLLTTTIAAYGAVVVALIAVVGERRISEARLVNPNPTKPYPINLFGVSDKTWLPTLMCLTAALVIGMVVIFVRHYRRTGRLHPGVGAFIGLSIVMLLDPVFNWGMYVAYNPRLMHFPTSWGYVSLSPTLEPFWVLGAYPFFWLAPALGLNAAYRRHVRRRIKPGSWLDHHPLMTIFAFGLVVGAVYDYVAEMFLMNAGIWNYWQVAGPVLRWGNGFLPLYEVFWVGLEMAVILVLLQRDDAGRTVGARLARRFQIRGRRFGELTVAACLVFGLVFLHIGFFCALRATGQATSIGSRWQYPSLKVYDPDGRARSQGIPGPYFKGILSDIPGPP